MGLNINLNRNDVGSRKQIVPPVLRDGNTVEWHDYKKLVTKDGGNLVSNWGDLSGNGNDLIQNVGTNKPLWTPDGICFDGIDNHIKTLAYTFNQPETIYIVFKQITWTTADKIFDGFLDNTGLLYQLSTSPELKVYAGANSTGDSNLLINTLGIVMVLFDGGSSEFQINDNAPVTGNFGSANMGGFTLGASGAGGANFSNICTTETICRKIAGTTQDKLDIYNYLSKKHGI